ncbi:MAG: aspartate kinase [Paracoccaceae bacterium]|nr:aspartate kinase [Paracoccaceae bacterium]
MPCLVMKFGGTSVADLDRMERVAQRIGGAVADGHEVIAIVSARAGKTDELADLVVRTSPFYDAREYDAVTSAGENVTSGLVALMLQKQGIPARSWLGWQVPVETTDAHSAARISGIGTNNIRSRFNSGMKAAVVAGFQGVSPENRVTTLGRGGSDTTAVAFAIAFEAVRCDIYTDVDGIYTADPRIVGGARRLERISYEEMLELASLGAKVLQTRSVELAMQHRMPIRVLSSFGNEAGPTSGTIVCDEGEIMERNVVNGIACSRDEAKLTIVSVADRPGIAAAVFGSLAEAGVNVDMIVQNISEEGRTDITFSCPTDQADFAEMALAGVKESGDVNYRALVTDRDVAKVSVVGIGMRSYAGVAGRMFAALAAEGVNIKVIATSEIKISVLVDRKYMELAVRSLHDAFDLETGT